MAERSWRRTHGTYLILDNKLSSELLVYRMVSLIGRCFQAGVAPSDAATSSVKVGKVVPSVQPYVQHKLAWFQVKFLHEHLHK
jgi:hypothetical protein